MSGIKIDGKIGVRGRYKLIRRDANLNIVQETEWSKNLILNSGLNYILGQNSAGNNMFVHCVVGTGNAAVLPTNTALSNYNGVYTGVVSFSTVRNYTVSPFSLKHTVKFRFNPTGVARNIAEAGMVFSTSSAKPLPAAEIHSRALITDGGSPTTVPVGADEYLDVVWEYTVFPGDQFSGSFNMTIDGVSTSFDYVARPSNLVEAQGALAWWASVGGNEDPASGYAAMAPLFPAVFVSGPRYTSWASSGDIGTVQQIPTGQNSANQATSASATTYVANSFIRSYEFVWGLDKANMAVKSMNLYFSGAASYQMNLTPTVAKVSTKIFRITVSLAIANV